MKSQHHIVTAVGAAARQEGLTMPRGRRYARGTRALAASSGCPVFSVMTDTVTLSNHIRARGGPEAADLSVVLTHLAKAGRAIATELGRAALIGQLGTTGETNVQGETVKKLDVWANDVVLAAMTESGVVCTLVSEEMEHARHLDDRCTGARYLVCFDPVDGSSK